MIAIINYNAGNITSVVNALEFLGFDYIITSNPNEIKKADKIIFPGQGRAGQAMQELVQKNLVEVIKNTTIPFLGICIGLQLLADYLEEDSIPGLGIIPGTVKKFDTGLKLPQIGWNNIQKKCQSKLFFNVPDNCYAYFVHSYYFETAHKYMLATTRYGIEYPSIIQKDNFYATQFHPEKSGNHGLQILKNFCEL